MPWYAQNRDMPEPPWCRTSLYASLDELRSRFEESVRNADVVIVGSYVPDGVAVGRWVQQTARGVTGFYDIDTPVTLAKLSRGDFEYLSPELVPGYDVYLSFTGGPTLRRIERELGSPAARALYCSVDPSLYFPEACAPRWDLGYLGTWSADRQPVLDALMLEAARHWPEGRFAVVGPQYPEDLAWPRNVERESHLPPPKHCGWYNAQRFTLNVTRADMVRAGWSPSVRLFEAAACGVPVVSDVWPGLEELFEPGREILFARSAADTLRAVRELGEDERLAIGARARRKILSAHTAAHRAEELVGYLREAQERRAGRRVSGNAS